MKKLLDWIVYVRIVVGDISASVRRWRPDVRGWPWHARWLWHRAVGRWAGWSLLLIGAIVIGAVVAVVFTDPDWLTGTGFTKETGSTTIRNVGLIGGGAIAILIAYWRSRLAQQDLLNKRYQEGAAMLGSKVLAVRLAGIYALERLAKDHPCEYHIEVMQSLCAFVRNPIGHEGVTTDQIWEDVHAAVDAISACHQSQSRLERKAKFRLDLRGADLSGATLRVTRLSNAWLDRAILTRATLILADLSGANLNGADLRETNLLIGKLNGATLVGADLTDADLRGAILTGAEFGGVFWIRNEDGTVAERVTTGLTQAQLDEARADPDDPPKLNDLRDADTRKRLVWRGKTIDFEPQPHPPPIPDA